MVHLAERGVGFLRLLPERALQMLHLCRHIKASNRLIYYKHVHLVAQVINYHFDTALYNFDSTLEARASKA